MTPLSLPRATALAAAMFSSFLGAQQWQQATPTVSPSARNAAPVVFDIARGKVALFGGFDGNLNAPLGDHWEWDGTNWAQAMPATLPPARWNAMLAYDSRRMRIVLFGGTRNGLGPTNETWEFDGTNWAQRTAASPPPPREAGGMAYDEQRGVCVLFGGFLTPNNPHGDCWEWDGVNWSQRTSNSMPTGRQGHGLVYDAARVRTMLFGGTTATGASQETWTYDGANWTLATPANAPSPRTAVAMAFDSVRGKTVLHGGADATYAANYGETWEWDGANWVQVTGAGPGARHGGAMAFDARRGRMLLFGGRGAGGLLGDTWRNPPSAAATNSGLRLGPSTQLSFPFHPIMHTGNAATIEYWIRGAAGCAGVEWQRYAHSAEHKALGVGANGALFYVYAGSPWGGTTYGGMTNPGPGTVPFDNAWHHVAFVRRANGTWSIYVDGNLIVNEGPGTGFGSGCWWSCGVIQANTPTNLVNFDPIRTSCDIDELRISNNERYTASFTPSTYFMPDGNTAMLLHFDEGTGATVGDFGLASQIGSFSGNSGAPTWSWVAGASPATTPATFATYGQGCAHSTNTPALGALNGSTPRLNQTLNVRLTGLPTPSVFVPLAFLGYRNDTALGLPLPFSMGLYGMPPQCQQYVEPDLGLVFTLTNSGGYADWPIFVPNQASLLGSPVYLQGLVFDWTLPYPLPAVSTNAAIATIGL